MNDADRLSARFDPYVRIPGASHHLEISEARSEMVRELLLTRAVEQAQTIVEAVERGDTHRLPSLLIGLDRESKGFFTSRIVAMLSAYARLLTDGRHADVQRQLDIVFRPLGTWIGGQYAITSPALLVVQSILYSHCEWFHESGWEAHSAVRAYRELRGTLSNQRAIVSEAHARFIAAIIAHQTLLRASWITGPGDQPEVYALRHGKWATAEDGESIGLGIAHTLFPFLKKPQARATAESEGTLEERQLAAALVLHSMCLFCRHTAHEIGSMDAIKSQAIDSLNAMLAPRSIRSAPALAYFQYARYVIAAGAPKLVEEAKKHVLGSVSAENATFAFQRVPSKNVWRGQVFDPVSITKHTAAVAAGGVHGLVARGWG